MVDNRIVLRLGDDGRVLGAAWCRTVPKSAVTVPRDALPAGDVRAYRYVDGTFVHDPLPAVEPAPEPPTDAERIAALEQLVAEQDAALIELAALIGGGA